MTSDTSPQPISPLRARMIEDMSVRSFKDDTRRDYVRHVRAFAAFIGRSPDTATAEELRLFQLHQTQSGMQPPSVNSAVSALRFFFTVTLDRRSAAGRLFPRHLASETLTDDPGRSPEPDGIVGANSPPTLLILRAGGAAATKRPFGYIARAPARSDNPRFDGRQAACVSRARIGYRTPGRSVWAEAAVHTVSVAMLTL